MSVLFKALQKAEKENEQRQAATGGGFDAAKLAGGGSLRSVGGRGINWRTAGVAAALVLAVALGAAFFLAQPPAGAPQMAAVKPAVPGTRESIPVMQPPEATAPAPATASAPTEAAQPGQVAATPATPDAPAATAAASPTPQTQPAPAAEAAPTPTRVAEAPAAAPEEASAAVPAAAKPPAQPPAAPQGMPLRTAPEKMPDLAADSPARMLNPPISVRRSEIDLEGVGNAVQVRQVSQDARANVSNGYNALVRGAYDMALDFYERALREEPNSVLAMLGRGAALQKQGKTEDARMAYEQVLKVDPANREALSNLTTLLVERSPNEALGKLQDLEKQYPRFSPITAQIGLTYAKLGAMNEALDYLNRATQMSPETVMYQYNMALVLDHLGRSAQAVSVYETVLASMSAGRGVLELSKADIERRVQYLKAR
jgi:Tfp pilus assembly protein PilF